MAALEEGIEGKRGGRSAQGLEAGEGGWALGQIGLVAGLPLSLLLFSYRKKGEKERRAKVRERIGHRVWRRLERKL